MRPYLELLRHVLENGERRTDRTGTGTISLFGAQSRYDLRDGFPLVTTKKVLFPAVVRELLWFLRGSTNINDDLNQHTPSETRATVLSVSSLVMSLQIAFFEPVVGFITDDISIRAAFGFVSAYFLVVMPPLFYFWRRAYVPTPAPTPALAAEAA